MAYTLVPIVYFEVSSIELQHIVREHFKNYDYDIAGQWAELFYVCKLEELRDATFAEANKRLIFSFWAHDENPPTANLLSALIHDGILPRGNYLLYKE